MKKYLLITLVLALVLLLTGCEEKIKTITCTMKQSEVDIELTLKFVDKIINNMESKYIMDLSSYSTEQIEEVKKQNFCDVVSKNIGINDALIDCKQDVNDKILSVVGNVDLNKLNDEYFEKDSTPEEAQIRMEKRGYTCIIK